MAINIQDIEVNLTWLRDNCRCQECYNWDTYQRKLNDIEIHKLIITSFVEEGNEITITWNDGHLSKYNVQWIRDQQRSERRLENKLWMGNEKENEIPIVSNNDNELQIVTTLTSSLLQFGIGIVKDVPPTMEATEKTVKKIGPVMHTFYGGMWTLNNTSDFEVEGNKDTAYSTQELSPHTDNTYSIEPAGLQIFHCLKQAEEGGETILVDGFKAAQLLKEENQQHFECLKSTQVEWQCINNKYHYTCVKPVITTFPNSENFEQIRYNIYDRSPRICSSPRYDQNTFYSSLKHFRNIVNDGKMEWAFKMSPGTVFFINNWRVFHGRKVFSGNRFIVGCYMGMNALLSNARMLKLIS